MIKRTLYFGNPAFLNLKNNQIQIRLPEIEKNKTLSTDFKDNSTITIPIEDVGIVILDNQQITITHGLVELLLQNNVALLTVTKLIILSVY